MITQLSHMTVTMKSIQAQLKTLASAQTNQPRSKKKHYFWSCGRNFNHRIRTLSSKKAGHQEEVYYKKRMGGSENGCEWRLMAIVNKFEINKPKISLINYIDTPPNPTIPNMLSISESGVNKHLARQSTPTTTPVIVKCNEIKTTIWKHYGVHTYINTPATRSKQASKIDPHFPKFKTAPWISLGVLCDDGYTITLEKQEKSIEKNGEEILKGTRNKKTGMWEVPLGPQQSENLVNNIMAKTSKPE